ncbi:uncharacterized protein LOC131066462 [Cryptomeria japonica]|uniref:uncharacterized protein LOC131066462 n=1 Tax=Cryptomeria japonica TaxID=3369 RepID=UPI0027DA41E7|nr:uncharacterized protein LOC131066462 [Cryptomeria japonica]
MEEVHAKSDMNEETTTVVYLSSLLNHEDDVLTHKCDKRCRIEHVWANIYRCKLTGSTHICDKNCNQRIVYDNYSCVCRVSGQVFPLTPAEQLAVRGIVRRRVEADPAEACAPKRRRRDGMINSSPFERSFSFVPSICNPAVDSMDIS